MKYEDAVIAVFAKAPIPGTVNTRLSPILDDDEAAKLQEDLIQDRLTLFVNSRLCDVKLYCTPDTTHPYFQLCHQKYGVALETQSGEDLGRRMSEAVRELSQKYQRIIIIGTDAPALGLRHIEEMMHILEGGCDAVVVPAEDGGYVAIGMSEHLEHLFLSVPWGTERVLQKTRANAVAMAIKLKELEECWDIDRPEDYSRYLEWREHDSNASAD